MNTRGLILVADALRRTLLRGLRATAVACALLSTHMGMLPAAQAADLQPPARVGRLSVIQGTIEMVSASEPDWAGATLNMPVTTSTTLFANPASRAEVSAGSNAIRFNGNSQISFTELDDAGIQVDLARGSVAMRVRSLAANDRMAMSADRATLRALEPGRYRIDFAPGRRQMQAKVFFGSASLTAGGNTVQLYAGQQATVDTATQTVIAQGDLERNGFDNWNDQRDRKQDRVASTRYAPADMTGVDSLDEYGSWRTETSYGAVWYPNGVAADWAPYRYGHWRWIAPWGYTWVDDAPWGFAPFHYGRWIFLSGQWGWIPGPVAVRPVYAPALVGFYGGGNGFNWGATPAAPVPAVGWFPLGPGELFRPPYTTNVTYLSNINNGHVAGNVITGVGVAAAGGAAAAAAAASFRYAQTSFAATVVPKDAFVTARPVAASQLVVAPARLAAAQVAGTAAGLPPPSLTRTVDTARGAAAPGNTPFVPPVRPAITAGNRPDGFEPAASGVPGERSSPAVGAAAAAAGMAASRPSANPAAAPVAGNPPAQGPVDGRALARPRDAAGAAASAATQPNPSPGAPRVRPDGAAQQAMREQRQAQRAAQQASNQASNQAARAARAGPKHHGKGKGPGKQPRQQ
jgi:hypothetical protein